MREAVISIGVLCSHPAAQDRNAPQTLVHGRGVRHPTCANLATSPEHVDFWHLSTSTVRHRTADAHASTSSAVQRSMMCPECLQLMPAAMRTSAVPHQTQSHRQMQMRPASFAPAPAVQRGGVHTWSSYRCIVT